jgi:hypothetical protein
MKETQVPPSAPLRAPPEQHKQDQDLVQTPQAAGLASGNRYPASGVLEATRAVLDLCTSNSKRPSLADVNLPLLFRIGELLSYNEHIPVALKSSRDAGKVAFRAEEEQGSCKRSAQCAQVRAGSACELCTQATAGLSSQCPETQELIRLHLRAPLFLRNCLRRGSSPAIPLVIFSCMARHVRGAPCALCAVSARTQARPD